MGGYGSTRWGNHRRKALIEEATRLDISFLVHESGLRPGCDKHSRLVWMRDGHVRNSMRIGLCAQERTGVLRMSYIALGWGGDRLDIDDSIELVTTVPHFGGLRWWFRCPECGRRVTKLYMPYWALHFRCRLCHGLVYESSQNSRHDEHPLNRWLRRGCRRLG